MLKAGDEPIDRSIISSPAISVHTVVSLGRVCEIRGEPSKFRHYLPRKFVCRVLSPHTVATLVKRSMTVPDQLE